MLNKTGILQNLLEIFTQNIKIIVQDKNFNQDSYKQIFINLIKLQYERACMEKVYSKVYIQFLISIVKIKDLLEISQKTQSEEEIKIFLKTITDQEDIEKQCEQMKNIVKKGIVVDYIVNELKNCKPDGQEYQITDDMNEQNKNIVRQNVITHLYGSLQYSCILYQEGKELGLFTKYNFLSCLIFTLRSQMIQILQQNNIQQDKTLLKAKDIKSIQDAKNGIKNNLELLQQCKNTNVSMLLFKGIIQAVTDNYQVFNEKEEKNEELKYYILESIRKFDQRFLDSYLQYSIEQMDQILNQQKEEKQEEENENDELTTEQIIQLFYTDDLQQIIVKILNIKDEQVINEKYVENIEQTQINQLFDLYYNEFLIKKFIGQFTIIYRQCNNEQKMILFKYILYKTFDIFNKQTEDIDKEQMYSCIKFINRTIISEKDKHLQEVINILKTKYQKQEIQKFIKQILKILIQQQFEDVLQEDLYDLLDEDVLQKTLQLIKQFKYYEAQSQKQIIQAQEQINTAQSLPFTEDLSWQAKQQLLTTFDKQVIYQLRKVFKININQQENLQYCQGIFKYLEDQGTDEKCYLQLAKDLDCAIFIYTIPKYDLRKQKFSTEYKYKVYDIEQLLYKIYTQRKKDLKQTLKYVIKKEVQKQQFSYYQFLELLWNYVPEKQYTEELKSYLPELDDLGKVLKCIQKMQEYKELYGKVDNLYQDIKECQ